MEKLLRFKDRKPLQINIEVNGILHNMVNQLYVNLKKKGKKIKWNLIHSKGF